MGIVLERFGNETKELTFAEKQILYYIDNHLEEAKHQSLTQMAERNNVSTTTVIRMCHKLGLEGFSELKYILKTLEYNTLPKGKNTVEWYKTDLDYTLSNVSIKQLELISDILVRSNRIMIIAVGLSKMLGEYFSKLFMQVNKQSSYVYESHMIDLLPNMIQPKDAVIFISSSGETKTLIQTAEKIRYKNIETISITNNSDSTLAKITRQTLSTNVQKMQFAGYDLTARSTLVVLMDLLFHYFLNKHVSSTRHK